MQAVAVWCPLTGICCPPRTWLNACSWHLGSPSPPHTLYLAPPIFFVVRVVASHAVWCSYVWLYESECEGTESTFVRLALLWCIRTYFPAFCVQLLLLLACCVGGWEEQRGINTHVCVCLCACVKVLSCVASSNTFHRSICPCYILNVIHCVYFMILVATQMHVIVLLPIY